MDLYWNYFYRIYPIRLNNYFYCITYTYLTHMNCSLFDSLTTVIIFLRLKIKIMVMQVLFFYYTISYISNIFSKYSANNQEKSHIIKMNNGPSYGNHISIAFNEDYFTSFSQYISFKSDLHSFPLKYNCNCPLLHPK